MDGVPDQRGEDVVTPLTDRAIDPLERPPFGQLAGGGRGEEFSVGTAQSEG